MCMLYQGTLNLIENISADHDIDVQFWSDEMKDVILNKEVLITYTFTGPFHTAASWLAI